MKAGLIVHFREPVPGREKFALDYRTDVDEYWGKLAADGKCTFPELFFGPVGGGIWMVKGDLEYLEEAVRTPVVQELLYKGGLLFREFGYEFYVTGESADEYILKYKEVAKGFGFI